MHLKNIDNLKKLNFLLEFNFHMRRFTFSDWIRHSVCRIKGKFQIYLFLCKFIMKSAPIGSVLHNGFHFILLISRKLLRVPTEAQKCNRKLRFLNRLLRMTQVGLSRLCKHLDRIYSTLNSKDANDVSRFCPFSLLHFTYCAASYLESASVETSFLNVHEVELRALERNKWIFWYFILADFIHADDSISELLRILIEINWLSTISFYLFTGEVKTFRVINVSWEESSRIKSELLCESRRFHLRCEGAKVLSKLIIMNALLECIIMLKRNRQ